MVYPIVAYGDPVLKREADEIEEDYDGLQQLVDDMYETMYASNGVGLAAPQIGKSIRLFVVDATPFAEDEDDPLAEGCEGFVKEFINPIIEEETGDEWSFEEGCLSIPKIREDIFRKEKIRITYYDRQWDLHDEVLEGYAARVVQHEYDHVEGILFTDHLGPLKKRLLKKKLTNISRGDIEVSYRMRFPVKKR